MLDKVFELLSNIVKNNQILVLLVGVSLVFVSAVNEFTIQQIRLNADDLIGRIILATCGAVLILWSLYSLSTKGKGNSADDLSKYGAKVLHEGSFEISSFISDLRNEFNNTAPIEVKGTVEEALPPDKTIWLFHIYEGHGILYFPQSSVHFSGDGKSWSGVAYIGKSHSQNSKVMAAIAGESGSFTCEYYWLVQKETKKYIAFKELPPDIYPFDFREVEVTRKSSFI